MNKTENVLREVSARGALPAPDGERQEVPSISPHVRRPSDLLSKLGAKQEIARMREPQQRSHNELVAQKIIYPEMVDKRVCSSFRHLRTTLFQKAGTHNFTLLVSAVSAQGGASFVARNLAAAVAFDETKTALLIDCSLTRPTLDNLILIRNNQDLLGLTDYLRGVEPSIEGIIYPTGIPRLRAIPAGLKREAATECFSSPQLHTLLQEVRQRYPERCVILDAPSMEEPDARILADLCDYVLLVIPYGRATKEQVMSAALAVDPEQLIGTVFNDVPMIRPDRK